MLEKKYQKLLNFLIPKFRESATIFVFMRVRYHSNSFFVAVFTYLAMRYMNQLDSVEEETKPLTIGDSGT